MKFRNKVVDGKAKFVEGENTVQIDALGGGKLKVYMELMYPYEWGAGEQSANLGDLTAEFAIDGDTAKYVSGDGRCTMIIKFVKPGTIKVTQRGTDADCDFGHNVTATGTYTKVNGKKPTFGEI
jgi:hypothetical protein